MEPWEQELDQYLAPHGVVFSEEASVQSFKQEMRARLNSIRLPLFSTVLLYDGAGSLIFRVTSLIILIWMCAILSRKWNLPEISFAVTIPLILVSLPGLWMWWYQWMPCEKRMQRMHVLFEKKVKERKRYPPTLTS